ncbi:putative membrane protein [Haloactinopolyspora alba]|uniref:Putative membrane protein n=1 Tax=Haloactinopolyspora alba TaxID=648780 RepID=A0A2P8DPQ0_9ACTN|nr:alpha/beta-hydrolase family protein [Haloactinopolyspora alba]PSK99186.1 putative membrane protein [Haloactinopolyspora alba]
MPVTTLLPDRSAQVARRIRPVLDVPVLGRFLRWLTPDYGGLIGATCFFCWSLTPSLLPRTWIYQAIVSGLTAIIGYALGSLLGWLVRVVVRQVRPSLLSPSRRVRLIAWWALSVVATVAASWYLTAAAGWQTQIRSLMGVESPGPNHYVLIVLVAGAIFVAFLAVGRLVRGASRRLRRFFGRWVPPLAALVASVTCVAVVSFWSWTGLLYPSLLGVANDAFAAVNQETEAGNNAPTSRTHSGGPDSLVTWDSLGRKGREFVSSGPTAAELTAFNGRPATDPVRAYVGMNSAETPAGLASLAVRELERAGGFEREVLVVVTTTGTGWVDGAAADALEYLYNGDSAIVATQYSYLPSWISFVADQEQVRIAGRALFEAVHAAWRELPADSRPRLVVYGESLGALGSSAPFDGLDDLQDKVDGALWVGSPTGHALRSELTEQRDPGSPARLPVYEGGEDVKFWGGWQEPMDLEFSGDEPPVLFLQHASDPVALWSWDLMFSQPEWITEEHGPDVIDNFDWYPFVTFWQITADMALSATVPAGHGHNYGGELVDAWLAVAPPGDWDHERTDELREMVRSFAPVN